MNVLWGMLVLIGVTAVTVSTMLFVRRRAPEGSYFSDGDRASGVFGVLATGFSVLLAFIIFLAFQSYDESRSGAEEEATTVAQQVETAQFLPSKTSPEVTGELVCYARSVVGTEWRSLEAGTLGNGLNPWGAAMFHTIKAADPKSATEQSAYDRWMDQTMAREQARNQRIHGATGIIPMPLWLALYLITTVIFAYMLFFADRAERVATQAMLMGSVTVVVTTSLLLLVFFDRPYGGFGKLRPTAMERTVSLINSELRVAGIDLQPPCDSDGNAR
ncbi:MAG: bestrophin-like domain [Aeromicrobium sp.]